MSRIQRRRVGVGRQEERFSSPFRTFQQLQVFQYKVQAYELSVAPGATSTWRLVQDVGPLYSLADAERVFLQMCSVEAPLARRIVKLFSKGTFGNWTVKRECGGG